MLKQFVILIQSYIQNGKEIAGHNQIWGKGKKAEEVRHQTFLSKCIQKC